MAARAEQAGSAPETISSEQPRTPSLSQAVVAPATFDEMGALLGQSRTQHRHRAVDAACADVDLAITRRLRDARRRGPIGVDRLNADVVGASVVVRLDTRPDRALVFPRYDRINQPIAPAVGEILVAHSEPLQVASVVR